MWDEIDKYQPMFESAVLSVTGEDGYPYSVRCHPTPDRRAEILRLDLAQDAVCGPGPASILFHRHDENLWNQKVLVLKGRLEEGVDGWVFRPQKLVPDLGYGTPPPRTSTSAAYPAHAFRGMRSRPSRNPRPWR